jgi:sulfur relay (sulfurtransferase) complex TusBCD TusD component (DsrE family)
MLVSERKMAAAETTSTQRSLGILIAVSPSEESFGYGIGLAQAAQKEGVQVYLYLLDDAVESAPQTSISDLVHQGVKVTACAYAARRRHLDLNDNVTFGGLGLLNDIIANTDRFVGFCH